jgi:rRNA maturation endonuclease Nob1
MDLLKKLKSGASKAADVAQQTVEITKLTTQIAGRKREIEKNKTLMGHEVYEAYKKGDLSLAEAKVGELCISIVELESEISSLEQQIKRVRNEKTCACGKDLAADAKFCPSCGRPQIHEHTEVITIDVLPSTEAGDAASAAAKKQDGESE